MDHSAEEKGNEKDKSIGNSNFGAIDEVEDCERGGVLDPMAWRDTAQWSARDGNGGAEANSFTAEKALGEGVGLPCEAGLDRCLLGDQCGKTGITRTMNGKFDHGEVQEEELADSGRGGLFDVVKKVSSFVWNELIGSSTGVEKHVSDLVEQRERERQQGWALAGEPADLRHSIYKSPSNVSLDLHAESISLPGGSVDTHQHGDMDGVQGSGLGVPRKSSRSHQTWNLDPALGGDGEVLMVGLGKGAGSGGSGSWTLGSAEDEDEDEPPVAREDDDFDQGRVGGGHRIASQGGYGEAEDVLRIRKERSVQLLRGMMMARHRHSDHLPARIEEGLYLGSVGASLNRQELQRRGVTHILTVANNLPPPFPHLFKYSVVPVLDSPDVDLTFLFDQCFAFIDEARSNEGAVLVHCFAGRSRSVTVVVAYIMKTLGLPLDVALTKVREERPEACPNSGFMLQLRDYDELLRHERKTMATHRDSSKT